MSLSSDQIHVLHRAIQTFKRVHGLTVEEMSARCPGVSTRTLNTLFAGRRNVSEQSLLEALAGLKMTPDEMILWYAQQLELIKTGLMRDP